MAACVRAAYSHYIERIGKPPGPMLDDYYVVVREHEAFVGVYKARVVGVLVLLRSNGGLLLDNIAVHPRYQGRGIGRMLLEHAELFTLEAGFECLDLYTHALMTENIDIYRRHGYYETERKRVKGFDRVYMRKRIKGAKLR